MSKTFTRFVISNNWEIDSKKKISKKPFEKLGDASIRWQVLGTILFEVYKPDAFEHHRLLKADLFCITATANQVKFH